MNIHSEPSSSIDGDSKKSWFGEVLETKERWIVGNESSFFLARYLETPHLETETETEGEGEKTNERRQRQRRNGT